MKNPLESIADEAVTFHRACYDAALEGQRGFQKQLETAFEVSREILAFQRDQQVAWMKIFTPPSAS